jgi:hypothetical protein
MAFILGRNASNEQIISKFSSNIHTVAFFWQFGFEHPETKRM